MRLLRDRVDAGEQLAEALIAHLSPLDQVATPVVVLGLPRGGVPVAYVIARRLRVPLGVYIVRKVGVPGHKELAMGAVASGNVRVLNEDVIRSLEIPEGLIAEATAAELAEIARREEHYGIADRPLPLTGSTVILVDDGIATGATMRAAIAAIRQQRPARIVVAVGVAPPETCEALAPLVDGLVCLIRPDYFGSVGMWYADFAQVSDEEVCALLEQ